MQVLNATVEAYNLFSHLISQEGYWAQSGSVRRRQGLCPDFVTPPVNGSQRGQLFELKTFAVGPTRYASKKYFRKRRHAANQRAKAIQMEYVRKARKADRQWCGTPAD